MLRELNLAYVGKLSTFDNRGSSSFYPRLRRQSTAHRKRKYCLERIAQHCASSLDGFIILNSQFDPSTFAFSIPPFRSSVVSVCSC